MALVLERLSLRLRATPTSTASRCAAAGPGRSAASPTTPRPPRRAPASRRASSRAPSRDRLGALPRATGPARAADVRDRHRAARPLVVGGADLARGGAGRAARWPASGRSPSARALAEHEPERAAARSLDAGARARTCAPGTRRRSPTSPGRARRLELRVLREIASGRLRGAGADARRARAARRAGERLGVPRLRPAGRRLPLRAPARPLPGAVRGHRLRRVGGADDAQPRARPRPRRRCSNLEPPQPLTVSRVLDPLLGVPAADRGRAGPPRPQALRGARRARDRGPRADPRRRGVPAERGRRRASTSTACSSRPARATSASSSPGSSG